jgi:hypothetical protein
VSTKEADLQIAKALGCYTRMIGGFKQTFPDAIGDRYRNDIEGRRAFYKGWSEAELLIAARALSLVCDMMEGEHHLKQ